MQAFPYAAILVLSAATLDRDFPSQGLDAICCLLVHVMTWLNSFMPLQCEASNVTPWRAPPWTHAQSPGMAVVLAGLPLALFS